MEISPESTRLVAQFLAGVLSGGGTYAVAKAVFEEARRLGHPYTPRQKRMAILPLCAGIALAALAIEVTLDIAPLTADGVFLALTAAYTASQLFHARELSPEARP